MSDKLKIAKLEESVVKLKQDIKKIEEILILTTTILEGYGSKLKYLTEKDLSRNSNKGFSLNQWYKVGKSGDIAHFTYVALLFCEQVHIKTSLENTHTKEKKLNTLSIYICFYFLFDVFFFYKII